MSHSRVTVIELAPAADELWELPQSASAGYLDHERGRVALPDVASGAKLRPRVRAAYASGKATNVARALDAFLRADANTPLAAEAKAKLDARLVTFLPGQSGGYRHAHIPGELLSQFTPGGAYLACLQARDLHAVELSLVALPPAAETQRDRRCMNIVAQDGEELVNFSPYLFWERSSAEAVFERVAQEPTADIVVLGGSLPLVEGAVAPSLYADIIGAIKARSPDARVTLDVGGEPLRVCIEEGGDRCPDVVCINTDEYAAVPAELWREFPGIAVVHDERGCWTLRGHALTPADFNEEAPDVAVPEDVSVIHTICAGDAAHGGLVLGLMLYGDDDAGLHKAVILSQACALTVVESEDSIRGLTAEKIEGNVGRVGA